MKTDRITGINGIGGIPPISSEEPPTVSFENYKRAAEAPARREIAEKRREATIREQITLAYSRLPHTLRERLIQDTIKQTPLDAYLPPETTAHPITDSEPVDENPTPPPPIEKTLKQIHDSLETLPDESNNTTRGIFLHSRNIIKWLWIEANRLGLEGTAVPTLQDVMSYYQSIRFNTEEYGRPYLIPADYKQFERELEDLDAALYKFNEAFNILTKDKNYTQDELKKLRAPIPRTDNRKFVEHIEEFLDSPLDALINMRNQINEYFDFNPITMKYNYMADLGHTEPNHVRRIEQAIILTHICTDKENPFLDTETLLNVFKQINLDLLYLLSLRYPPYNISLDILTMRDMLHNMSDTNGEEKERREAHSKVFTIEAALKELKTSGVKTRDAKTTLLDQLTKPETRYRQRDVEKLLFLQGPKDRSDYNFPDGTSSKINCGIDTLRILLMSS